MSLITIPQGRPHAGALQQRMASLGVLVADIVTGTTSDARGACLPRPRRRTLQALLTVDLELVAGLCVARLALALARQLLPDVADALCVRATQGSSGSDGPASRATPMTAHNDSDEGAEPLSPAALLAVISHRAPLVAMCKLWAEQEANSMALLALHAFTEATLGSVQSGALATGHADGGVAVGAAVAAGDGMADAHAVGALGRETVAELRVATRALLTRALPCLTNQLLADRAVASLAATSVPMSVWQAMAKDVLYAWVQSPPLPASPEAEAAEQQAAARFAIVTEQALAALCRAAPPSLCATLRTRTALPDRILRRVLLALDAAQRACGQLEEARARVAAAVAAAQEEAEQLQQRKRVSLQAREQYRQHQQRSMEAAVMAAAAELKAQKAAAAAAKLGIAEAEEAVARQGECVEACAQRLAEVAAAAVLLLPACPHAQRQAVAAGLLQRCTVRCRCCRHCRSHRHR